LKEEALDRTLWRTRFGRVYGPVVRQTTEWMNEWPCLAKAEGVPVWFGPQFSVFSIRSLISSG
jgi:hypothetical protein